MTWPDVRADAVARLVEWNNRHVHTADPAPPNPRPIEHEAWYHGMRAVHPTILGEWRSFVSGGGRLPLIDSLLQGPQGNVGGWWQAGGLIVERRPRGPLAAAFPGTVAALLTIPGLLSAMWSVLGPGAELPPHAGTNAGALNLLVGVDCPAGSGHDIDGKQVSLDGGDVVIFDDTFVHSAWNRSDEPRVLLIGGVLRPVPGLTGRVNTLVQYAQHRLTPRYYRAIEVGAELHRALNE